VTAISDSVVVSEKCKHLYQFEYINGEYLYRKIEICNEIDHWFTANQYCQTSKEQATIGLCWSECFCFPFTANVSNAIMSNQNAQIQRKIYEMYSTQTCSLCEISVKKQWSSQGCVKRHLYSCYSVTHTHLHLSLNFPAKAHSTPSFSTPVFSTPATWCHVSTPAFSAPPVCPSVTRVDQSKTVEVRIMQFSPYSSPSL